MKTMFTLNTTIFFYNQESGFNFLEESEIKDCDLEKLKALLNSIPGKSFKKEYIPNKDCIKCSAVIYSSNDDFIIEKYFIYNLEDFINKDFLSLFKSIKKQI